MATQLYLALNLWGQETWSQKWPQTPTFPTG